MSTEIDKAKFKGSSTPFLLAGVNEIAEDISILSKDGEILAKVFTDGTIQGDRIAKANARIFAASKDLLDALQQITAQLIKGCQNEADVRSVVATLKACGVDTSIKKALGHE